MAWPKGKPRGPRKPLEAIAAIEPASKKTWTMKAGNNWDDAQEGGESPDRYHIPQDMFPEGMDLQWNTQSIYGQKMNQHIGHWVRVGWTPVHCTDFDGRFKNFSSDEEGFVVLDGMALCARPKELSDKARRRDAANAREQITLKEQAFRGGEIAATGANHPSALATNRISRTMERIDIPKE